MDLYYDNAYKTTGDDYWIAVLFQEESNKNFHPNRGYQTLNYAFGVHTAEASRITWSYSTINVNGETYKIAYSKISGFTADQTVTGLRLYPRLGTYYFYAAAVYANEQDALSFAGMFPVYEDNQILSYGLYNTGTDCKGLKPSGTVPPVDAGTAWGAPESKSAVFNETLKGFTVSSSGAATWAGLHFNKELTTTGDGLVFAVLYKHASNAALNTSYLLSNYQFGVYTDTDKRINSFRYVQLTIDGMTYTLAYATVDGLAAGSKVTGVRVHIPSNQSYTFIAAAALKNDVDMDKIFDMIVTTTKPLDEANGKYEGSQIRTTLVPFRDKSGVIHETDARQGLRFCFELPDIGDSIAYQGNQYEVIEASALVILKNHLAGTGELTLDNLAIADKMMIQSELVEWTEGSQTYKSAYIYNIPEEHKDTVIVVRAYLACKDNMGETVYFYSDAQEKSLTDVYNSMVEAGDAHLLDPDVLSWWE